MKRYRSRKVFSWLEASSLVVCILLGIFFTCKCIHMYSLQQDIIGRLSKLEIELQSSDLSSGGAIEGISSAYNLADQVSTSLGIISAGITVFTILGGFLSTYNVARAKEVEDTMREMSKLLEDQQELKAARLLQDGRVCASRGQLHHAKGYFENTIKEAPGTTAALTARYELLLIYADALENEMTLQKIQDIFSQLRSELKEHKQDRDTCDQLLADAYCILGCAYGKCAVVNDGLNDHNIKKAEEYLKKALRYNWEDVDYHKNMAYTYALTDKIEKCCEELEYAIAYAKREPFYETQVSQGRLQKLFDPGKSVLSKEMKNMLRETFYVTGL